jgi:hypothetical protein
MNPPDTLVCKPTSWFLTRAVVMLAMFGGLAFYFHFDATTGYPRKNAVYYLHKTFQDAGDRFLKSDLTADEWNTYAAGQTVALPDDPTILPPEVRPGMKWPEILRDARQMKEKSWNKLWEAYSADWPHWNMDATPPDHPYDAGKIREQWIVGAICAAISLASAFILLRTLRRRIAIDHEAIYAPDGRRVPFARLIRLDLRKWHTKGLAFADYRNEDGSGGRIRLDGMTYGGFAKEDGEPAERLMKRLRGNFSGELIDYAPAASEPADPAE